MHLSLLDWHMIYQLVLQFNLFISFSTTFVLYQKKCNLCVLLKPILFFFSLGIAAAILVSSRKRWWWPPIESMAYLTVCLFSGQRGGAIHYDNCRQRTMSLMLIIRRQK